MIHERLDLSYWKQIFSLAHLREEARGKPPSRQPAANIISSPYDIAVVEQLREEAFVAFSEVRRVPTDVVLWSLGEPERREVTKIGGLPYREQGKPWPVASSGRPMTFVAQICFADSRDITPLLPGDLLLIFIEGVDWTDGWEAEPHYTFLWGLEDDENSEVLFEWVSLHDHPLVAEEAIPKVDWQLVPCYGMLHRTWDYPDANGLAYPGVSRHIPTVLEATKIGGVCPWSNVGWSLYALDETKHYLCTLSSLAQTSADFPFLNVPKTNDPRLETLRRSEREFLLMGDVGFINLFLGPDGTLRWRAHDN